MTSITSQKRRDRKDTAPLASFDDYADLKFEPGIFEKTNAEREERYQDAWSIVAIALEIIRKDQTGCRDFVEHCETISSDVMSKLSQDLEASRAYLKTLESLLATAQMRLLAGGCRLAKERGERW